MRISDWSSDVCSSDLILQQFGIIVGAALSHQCETVGQADRAIKRRPAAALSGSRMVRAIPRKRQTVVAWRLRLPRAGVHNNPFVFVMNQKRKTHGYLSRMTIHTTEERSEG